jgi:energy-coupling factor transporter ATP-binding protein EcfA2
VIVHALPPAPETIEQSGVGRRLLFDLVLKLIHIEGLTTVSALSGRSRLPIALISELVDEFRELALLETLGTQGRDFAAEMRYALTGKGHEWALGALERSQYVGPAPVSLEAFWQQVEKQRLAAEAVGPEQLLQSMRHLVLPEELLARLGPAVNSGESILLYGRSGNGKTAIAEALRGALRDTIAVPYCIAVDGQIINYFDAHVHEAVADREPEGSVLRSGATRDRRWVACRRPVTVVGGELTVEMLDLVFDPASKFYEAPAQLKATGGIFLLDDFGRQRATPESILNRWIVPLERGVDYLSLRTGKKFPVPFDGLVIFSTNLKATDVADEGMLRRLHHKIEVQEPSEEDYARIWARVCDERGIVLPEGMIRFLEENLYAPHGIARAGYHPRYLVEQVAAICEYEGQSLWLDGARLRLAWSNLLTG